VLEKQRQSILCLTSFGPKVDFAASWLRELLSGEESVLALNVKRAADERGIAWRTLAEAKKIAGVKSIKKAGKWRWYIKKPESKDARMQYQGCKDATTFINQEPEDGNEGEKNSPTYEGEQVIEADKKESGIDLDEGDRVGSSKNQNGPSLEHLRTILHKLNER
jgi:hypothetical protein